MKFLKTPLRFFAFILPLGFLIIAVCCKDSSVPPTPPPTPVDPQPEYPDSLAGVMKVEFRNHVDNAPLELDTRQYVSPAQDSFKVEDLTYYVSNVKLINSVTGKVYTEKNSYHLIDQRKNKLSFTLKGIPVKDFDKLEFAIGVDQAKNASTDNEGDLDVNAGMYWPWNTGYIFMRFNGKHFRKGVMHNGLVFHAGDDLNYKTFTFPLNQTITFAKNKPYLAKFSANVNGLFRTPNVIDFDVMNNVMSGTNAAKLAENYAAGMFTFEGVTQP